MSEFIWTDKSSEKWYVIYEQGHEGPYSLQLLEDKLLNRKINSQIKIWAEGLQSEVTLEAALHLATEEYLVVDDGEFPPPLPPLPIEEETEDEEDRRVMKFSRPEKVIEEISESDEGPLESHDDETEAIDEVEEVEVEVGSEELPQREARRFTLKHKILGSVGATALLFIGSIYLLQNNKKEMEFSRPQGMSLKVAERISDYLKFHSWDEGFFFKEFTSDDLSVVWLVNRGFQECDVTAHFKSQKDKLLTMGDEEVEFEGNGQLANHLTELKRFSFLNGKKIIPGMYDMTVSATNCRWDGMISKVMNFGRNPEETYQGKMSVILFPNGVEEFRELLDKVTKKKMEKALFEQNQQEMFWQNIQEKLQTLLAISLQIEQHFIDFLRKNERGFKSNLKLAIDEYIRKYGSFLTNFVVSNEESFKELSKVKGVSTRRNYEQQIASAAKNLGHTSMKLIEDLNDFKNPRRADLNQFEARVKKEFARYKENINQKIIQVSDDRSLPQDEASTEQSPSQE